MATNRQQNLELGRQFNDLWNARDPAFWRLFSADGIAHVGAFAPTLEQSMAGDRQLLAALPDATRQIVREVADEQFVVHHWRCTGHLTATDREVTWEGATIMRIVGEAIAEIWIFGDPADPRLD